MSISESRDRDASTTDTQAPAIIARELPETCAVRGRIFRLIRTVGAGGMSSAGLYATDGDGAGEPGMHMLMKSMHRNTKRETRLHALSETHVNRKLHDTHARCIVTLGRFGYLLLPWKDGCSLGHILDRQPMDGDTAMHMGFKLAARIVRMQQQHILHLDLKPDNVILTPDGDAEIIDFGLSRDLDSRRVTFPFNPAKTAGSAGFMPQEQWRSKPGYKSDLYALGHLLYESLTAKSLLLQDRRQSCSGSWMALALRHCNGLKPPTIPGGPLQGEFAKRLKAIDDDGIRVILEGLLMSRETDRVSAEQAFHMLYQECRTRGIDPYGPLYAALRTEPGARVEPDTVIDAIAKARAGRASPPPAPALST